jgi:CCR4-NOT transcription complex subunit 1
MANQLRYPNCHTYYFSFVVLELFLQDDCAPNTYEQITRVLLERIVCNRPHPVSPLLTSLTIVGFAYNLHKSIKTRAIPILEDAVRQKGS